MSLCDYCVRATIKFWLPVKPAILLLSPSPKAEDVLETEYLRFHFHLIRLYSFSARKFVQEADIHLLPFVPVMQDADEAVWQAEKRIYTSDLPSSEKADLLTAMTIFAGLNDRHLAKQLVERRRDLMIQSAAYDIIKQEGIEQGMQQSHRKAIREVLETRLDIVPLDIIRTLKTIEDTEILEELFIKALTVEDLQAFHAIMTQILEPVSPA